LLLESFCRAVIAHRLISARVATFDEAALATDKGVATFDTLTKMQERQARVMASIATKLRLTNQSRYTPQAAATASAKVKGARPWE